jgi:hypothetical protein
VTGPRPTCPPVKHMKRSTGIKLRSNGTLTGWAVSLVVAAVVGVIMRKARFAIRDMLWLAVVVALAVGWWIDRTRLAEQNKSPFSLQGSLNRFAPIRVDVVLDEFINSCKQFRIDGKSYGGASSRFIPSRTRNRRAMIALQEFPN